MSSINFNIRMDETLKERAFPVIESYGLTPAQAVKLFLTQIADTKTIPLTFTYQADTVPTIQTLRAIAELERGGGTKYENLDEAMQAMLEVVSGKHE